MSFLAAIDQRWLLVYLCTQLVFALYGAGVRRPFGSLQTVKYLSAKLRSADLAVTIADSIYVVFIIAMWAIVYMRLEQSFLIFAIIGFVFYLFGDFLARRIALVPSFVISVVLAVGCLLSVYSLWFEPA